MSFAKTLNSTERRDQFKETFKSFCELHYPNSTDFQQGPCPLFVSAFYYWLDHLDTVHHCDEIGACGRPRGTLNNLIMGIDPGDGMPPRATNIVCEFCEQTFRQVQDTLSDPKLIDDARKKIEQLCDYMKAVGQDQECLRLLRNYMDQAVEFVKKASPIQYCRAIKVCYNGLAPPDVRFIPTPKPPRRMPSLTDYNNFGIETDVLIGREPEPEENPVDCKRAPNCALCKTVVRELFKFIKDNRTEEKIKETLDKVCKLAYNGNEDKLEQCDEMVEAYSKEIVQLIIDETDPELICMILNQCTCERVSGDLSNFISLLDPTIAVDSARTCLECKFFINYLENSVENPHTQNFVRYWLLENLCANLEEDNLKASCEAMVNKYAGAFFHAIAQQLDSSQVCRELGACKNRKKTLVFDSYGNENSLNKIVTLPEQPLLRRRPVKQETPICEQCVDIVTQLDNYLSSHPIDQDVSVLIDNVCNNMPGDVAKNECIVIVRAFGSEIADAIASMENPRQLCSKIMLC